MKIWTSEYTFSHPWSTVVQAAWRKYPNPLNTSVVGLDVIDRQVQQDGILKTHRLMCTEWGVPEFVMKMIGCNKTGFVSEHSEVDTQNKVMTLKSRNLTFSNWLNVDEQLVYSQHPDDPTCTLLKQEAVITVKGLPMPSYLESLVTGTCSSKATIGRQAMEWVINKIKDEAHDVSRAAQAEMNNIKQFSPRTSSL